jgi:hypothetical protein
MNVSQTVAGWKGFSAPEGKELGMWGISYVKRKLHERRAEYEAQTFEEKAAWRTANATVWIALFTVVMAAVGSLTLYEVVEGGNDTHILAEAAKKQADKAESIADSVERAAKAMDTSNINAKTALDASIAASRNDQRAWMGMKAVGIAPLQAGSPVSVEPLYINTGKTIARKCVLRGVTVVNDGMLNIAEFVKSKTFLDKLRESKHVEIVAFPNFEISQRSTATHPETPGEIAAITAPTPTRFIYVFGEAVYEDISGTQHTTHICGMYVPAKAGFEACDGYEDAN